MNITRFIRQWCETCSHENNCATLFRLMCEEEPGAISDLAPYLNSLMCKSYQPRRPLQ